MDGVITPTAVSQSIYDKIRLDLDLDLLKRNIDFVDLTDIIDRDLPLTMLAPNNRAFERVTFGSLEGGDIITRHIFKGLLFCDVIANETTLITVDDEPLAVELRGENNEHIYVGGAYIYKCDIFSWNGVLHYVDRVIGLEYETVPPTTSPAPTITAQPTPYIPPTPAPVPTPLNTGAPINAAPDSLPTVPPVGGNARPNGDSSAVSLQISFAVVAIVMGLAVLFS